MFSTIKIWELVVLAVVVVGLWAAGDYHGHNVENAAWEAKQQKADQEAHQKELGWQKKLDDAAQSYETGRATTQNQLADAQKELKDAIAKNAAYSQCHVDAGFVRAYNGLIGSKPATSAQPGK